MDLPLGGGLLAQLAASRRSRILSAVSCASAAAWRGRFCPSTALKPSSETTDLQ
jgi:hypothetical protein